MKKLNIVGAGRVGQTLGFLWHSQRVFEIGAVCANQLEHAQVAVRFIQAGVPCEFGVLPAADVWLLTCPDDQLHDCCAQLAARGAVTVDSLVLHCSGALSAAEVLQSARDCGAKIASVHPIKSFAAPELAVQDFVGTFCGVEGDAGALAILKPAFAAIGATCFDIQSESKTLYHAASVMACNYLVALQEMSIQTFAQAGVPREQAMAILQPLVCKTATNVFKVGTHAALTGPIARGDAAVVDKQITALADWRADYAQLYCDLGRVAVGLTNHEHLHQCFILHTRVNMT